MTNHVLENAWHNSQATYKKTNDMQPDNMSENKIKQAFPFFLFFTYLWVNKMEVEISQEKKLCLFFNVNKCNLSLSQLISVTDLSLSHPYTQNIVVQKCVLLSLSDDGQYVMK